MAKGGKKMMGRVIILSFITSTLVSLIGVIKIANDFLDIILERNDKFIEEVREFTIKEIENYYVLKKEEQNEK